MKKICKFSLFALVLGAVAAAGVFAWRATRPVEDPWAEEYWEDGEDECCEECCEEEEK